MARIGFVTCVELGRACLRSILDAGGELAVMVTLRDDLSRNKSGRVYLDDLADQHAIPLLKIKNINDPEVVTAIREHHLDWLLIIGWSQIAGAEILESSKYGVLGMHPTLLPEGRGRASIPWAILKNLSATGVTMFKLDSGVDTGPIMAQVRIPLDDRETASTLYKKVADAHVELMSEAWAQIQTGQVNLTPQDDAIATLWPGRQPADGEFDPRTLTTSEVDRLVRALSHPYPGAFTRIANDRILRVWDGIADHEQNDSHGSLEGYPLATLDGVYTATRFEEEVG